MTNAPSRPRFWVVVDAPQRFQELPCANLSEVRRVLLAQLRTRTRDTVHIHGFHAELLRVRQLPTHNRAGRFLGHHQHIQRTTIRVESHHNKPLHLGELLGQLSWLPAHLKPVWPWKRNFSFRRGPVPGIAKRRGGHGIFRQPHTQAERRLNACVLADDGEVPARPVRNSLPSVWDDCWRHRTRNWKAQHKGRKAWDR